MDKPSKSWLDTRRAVLDRAQRTVVEPLELLQKIYAVVCICYLVGFLRFQFFETGSDFTPITIVLLLVAGACGVLVPILTGSVLAMHFTCLKLNKVANE